MSLDRAIPLIPLLFKLKAGLREITRGLDRTSEKIDQYEVALQEALKPYWEAGHQHGVSMPWPRAEMIAKFKEVLASAVKAAEGVFELKLDWRPPGWAVARIDGKEVRLAPSVASLLEVLAADNGRSIDALDGWKTREEVKQQLEKRTGRQTSDHALNTLVWRLRQALWQQAGLHKESVQINPRKHWLRFALKRTRADVASQTAAY